MTLEREPIEPLHMGANVEAPAVAAREAASAAALQVLDGNEIVQLSIKPSLWMIAAVSARFTIACLTAATILAVLAGTRLGWSTGVVYLFDAFLMLGVGRVLLASLQWASRVYVLTNRRAMRLSGILNVSVIQCPLSRIGTISLKQSFREKCLGLGTLRMSPRDDRLDTVNWEMLARPVEIQQILEKAVRRSQLNGR